MRPRMIAWSHDDPYWHYYPTGVGGLILALCGATVQSTGILENLPKDAKKECPECRDLKAGQVEMGL